MTGSSSLLAPGEFREPPFGRFLIADTRASLLWLVVRLYVGWQWLEAGLSKVGAPAWTGDTAGSAIAGFAKGALAKTSGDHPDVQGWYATFLRDHVIPNAAAFGYLVAVGETAAFFGVLMNANYLLAGTVSSDSVLLVLGALLMLAWRNAGWIALDRWVLPALGTPWQPGVAFGPEARARLGG